MEGKCVLQTIICVENDEEQGVRITLCGNYSLRFWCKRIINATTANEQRAAIASAWERAKSPELKAQLWKLHDYVRLDQRRPPKIKAVEVTLRRTLT